MLWVNDPPKKRNNEPGQPLRRFWANRGCPEPPPNLHRPSPQSGAWTMGAERSTKKTLLVGGFNPSENMLVKMDDFPKYQNRGEN